MRPRLLNSLLCAGLATAAIAAPCAAATPMTEAELADVRGGLMTPLGVEVGFAAAMRTYVDGRMVLETRLAWTPQGLSQTRSGALEATSGTDAWSLALGAPGGGETQILQSASGGQLLSVITNTANNRNIRQDTDIVLTLPQLADLQRQVSAQHMAASLQDALNTALQGAAR